MKMTSTIQLLDTAGKDMVVDNALTFSRGIGDWLKRLGTQCGRIRIHPLPAPTGWSGWVCYAQFPVAAQATGYQEASLTRCFPNAFSRIPTIQQNMSLRIPYRSEGSGDHRHDVYFTAKGVWILS
jgi:hypothetical protein